MHTQRHCNINTLLTGRARRLLLVLWSKLYCCWFSRSLGRKQNWFWQIVLSLFWLTIIGKKGAYFPILVTQSTNISVQKWLHKNCVFSSQNQQVSGQQFYLSSMNVAIEVWNDGLFWSIVWYLLDSVKRGGGGGGGGIRKLYISRSSIIF